MGLKTTIQDCGTAPAITSRDSLALWTIDRQSIRNLRRQQDGESIEFGRDAWPPASPSAGHALRLSAPTP